MGTAGGRTHFSTFTLSGILAQPTVFSDGIWSSFRCPRAWSAAEGLGLQRGYVYAMYISGPFHHGCGADPIISRARLSPLPDGQVP